MKTFHRLLKLAAMAFIAMVLASPSVMAQSTLTYAGWIGLYDVYVPMTKRMETEFEAKNPGVDFIRNDVPFEQALNQATVATLGGTPSDVMQLISGWVPAVQGIGGLEPLDDYFTAEEWAKIPSILKKSVTIEGKIYAIAQFPGPIALFYNRNLMRQAGLNPDRPPRTWPELKEAVLAICKLPPVDGAKVYGIALRTQRNPNSAQWALPIIFGHGGDLSSVVDGGSINTPQVRAAMQWMVDIVDAGCSPEGFSIGETRNTMAAGRAGFVFEGPWGQGLFSNLSGGKITTAPDGDIWVAPMPEGPDGKRRTISNSNQLAISSKSKNKKLAAEFIRYSISDPDFVNSFYETSKLLTSPRMDLLQSGPMGDSAYTQVFVDMLPNADDLPIKTPKFYAVLDAIAPAMQSMLAGGDIEQELIGADRKIQRLLSR